MRIKSHFTLTLALKQGLKANRKKTVLPCDMGQGVRQYKFQLWLPLVWSQLCFHLPLSILYLQVQYQSLSKTE